MKYRTAVSKDMNASYTHFNVRTIQKDHTIEVES